MISTIVAAMFAAGAPAYQDGTLWAYTGTASDSTEVGFIDVANLVKSAQLIRGWVAEVYSPPRNVNGKIIFASKELKEFDCDERRFRSVSTVLYAHDGDAATSFSETSPEWMYSPPGSVGYAILANACGLKEHQTMDAGWDPMKRIDMLVGMLEAGKKAGSSKK